ncbi:MAG: FAD-dependent oxidoreductase [Planctomycetota bacterium]|nr:FAD-dependent oxidoreductase [Planctomycetota bacterium]
MKQLVKDLKKTAWNGIVIITIFLSLLVSKTVAETILVEAESFENLGGWVIDQQFMDQMGSPFLLAHGLGEPVKDAVTTVQFPAVGKYGVWVRTRDWSATWNAPGAPGKFQLFIDNKSLETVFGTEGAWWYWQDGGTVEITKKQVSIALHDLTGFEGRCDAIIFTADADFIPPNEFEKLAAFRKKSMGLPEKVQDAGQFDLIVIGGGIAGTCAAISAARLGLDVALIQDRPVLGGNNSSEVRVWLNGETNFEPYPHIGDLVRELEPANRAHVGPANKAEIYEDQTRIALVDSHKNIRLFLRYRANGVQTDGPPLTKIVSVVAQNVCTAELLRFRGRWFADCTGDGCIGWLAGAEYQMTPDGDGHMGLSNLWNVVDTGSPVSFPRCPWALDLSDKPFPSSLEQLGVWYWESGFYYNPIEKAEYIRDWNLRAMYGAWDALKNIKKLYPNHKLNWAAYICGKRESRRLLGDVILAKEDFLNSVKYPDAFVPCTWTIDLHLPDPAYEGDFKGDAFISKAHYTQYTKPYWIPYRCFYSRNIENLFMAGRDISVTHEALGAVRVMRTCGMMGEVVGMAASLCKKHSTNPRGVYRGHLDELKELARQGIGK